MESRDKLYQIKIASGDIVTETRSMQEAEEVIKTKLSKRPVGSRLYLTVTGAGECDHYTYQNMSCGVREVSTPPVGANF